MVEIGVKNHKRGDVYYCMYPTEESVPVPLPVPVPPPVRLWSAASSLAALI